MELLKKIALLWVGCFFIGLTFGKIYSPDFKDKNEVYNYFLSRNIHVFSYSNDAPAAEATSLDKVPKKNTIVKIGGKEYTIQKPIRINGLGLSLLFNNHIYTYFDENKPIEKKMVEEGNLNFRANTFAGTNLSKDKVEQTLMATAATTGLGTGFKITDLTTIVSKETKNWQQILMAVAAGIGLGVGYYVGYRSEPNAEERETVEKILLEDKTLWKSLSHQARLKAQFKGVK